MIGKRFLIGIGIVVAVLTGTIALAAAVAGTAEQPGWQKALELRSDALDREYGLGKYARGTVGTSDPDWLHALKLRSDALDREYRLGKYARGTVGTSVRSNILNRKLTVRISGGKRKPGPEVTNGGVAGTAYFTASGAITDTGKVTTYRTVKGPFITLDFVSIGKKGTITFVVKIDTTRGTSRWTIATGTKAYKGLRGSGTEHENADYTVSTLNGTVSR